ncbi:MAG: tRNA (guanosine(46)-N7)-methyltransferase TrmB [Pseudomonadota bacterium]|nr:tRNA (guanosine(46)-N7)-methyltransferase TrmB [Pseudomonadota bacterium]
MRKTTSYQRRSGRLSANSKQQLEKSPHLIRDEIAKSIVKLQKDYDKCIVEMGFGMGDHLLANVIDNSDCLYIGIDIYKPGIARLLSTIEQQNILNCHLIEQDATESVEEIPKNSIDRIDIHHPDPWPKKRHHKRRLISSEFIKSLRGLLKKGGHIHIITDDENYFIDIVEILDNTTETKINYTLEKDRQPNSKYGKKAQQEGRIINGIIINK